MLELWHGSDHIIEHPEFGVGSPFNDYGLGFYCTEHVDLAREWACVGRGGGFANHYQLDDKDLSLLDLSAPEFTVLHWLALLVSNRFVQSNSSVAQQGMVYLRDHFLPNTDGIDLIVGYRADDSYFSFARAFVSNAISVDQLARAMRLGELGIQVVLKSVKAFSCLSYVGSEEVDESIYLPRRQRRDEDARRAYARESEQTDLDGLFLRDIIREGVLPDDPRLR